MSLDMNLDSTATVGAASGSFSQPIQVVDSLGSTHAVTVNFTKTAANAWSYKVTIPSADLAAGAGTTTTLATGNLTFNSSGQLLTPTLANGAIPVAITGLADAAADMSINWNLYTAAGSARLTQVAQPSAVSANAQNGTGAAQLLHVNLADGGDLVATYSNGQTETVGRLALASIRNPATLGAVGNNNFQVTQQTALPTIGEAGAGGRGQVVAASLESSTVDIAREFTNLIIYQRGYEANAKVITTEEQLGQTTNNLKQ
jgi:flagellar hook protein FlgE